MSTFDTSRDIPASPAEVFAAFETPARLAHWWGPDGFRNTFTVCEFKPGGAWQLTMHGPDGSNYPNESVFLDIERDRKVLIHHLSLPRFQLSVTLAPSETGTLLTWSQAFEDPAVAQAVRHIVVPANEQNLDRLTAEVLNPGHGAV
jgi:Activator of Hsp90 ATPase homolog 1-like protein